MAKAKIQHTIISYGIYEKWEASTKTLPKIKEFTLNIPAEIDIEFGFIINIKKGKGKKVNYCIYHPDITDDNGHIMPPFSGDIYINNNDWSFYLGDTIWAPISNKLGEWQMVIECENKPLADKTFIVDKADEFLEAKFWKKAGY